MTNRVQRVANKPYSELHFSRSCIVALVCGSLLGCSKERPDFADGGDSTPLDSSATLDGNDAGSYAQTSSTESFESNLPTNGGSVVTATNSDLDAGVDSTDSNPPGTPNEDSGNGAPTTSSEDAGDSEGDDSDGNDSEDASVETSDASAGDPSTDPTSTSATTTDSRVPGDAPVCLLNEAIFGDGCVLAP